MSLSVDNKIYNFQKKKKNKDDLTNENSQFYSAYLCHGIMYVHKDMYVPSGWSIPKKKIYTCFQL